MVTYEYHINNHDVVVYVNDAWNEFAVENNGAHLINNTLGRPIWNFISDGLVKKLYIKLLEAVRESKEHVRINFRCDSPEKMRFMDMELIPKPNNAVIIKNHLIKEKSKEEAYSADVISLMANRGFPMCSKCNKIKVSEEWQELTEVIKQGLVNHTSLQVHYGMCPVCIQDLKTSITRLKSKMVE